MRISVPILPFPPPAPQNPSHAVEQRKRVGRGVGSGLGKTCGKGHKGHGKGHGKGKKRGGWQTAMKAHGYSFEEYWARKNEERVKKGLEPRPYDASLAPQPPPKAQPPNSNPFRPVLQATDKRCNCGECHFCKAHAASLRKAASAGDTPLQDSAPSGEVTVKSETRGKDRAPTPPPNDPLGDEPSDLECPGTEPINAPPGLQVEDLNAKLARLYAEYEQLKAEKASLEAPKASTEAAPTADPSGGGDASWQHVG